MESLPSSFQCPHCSHQLVVNEPSQGAVSGPCPICANFISLMASSSSEQKASGHPRGTAPQSNIQPEREAPVLLQSKRFRRSKFAGNRRGTNHWFKDGLEEDPIETEALPLVIKRRSKASFVEPERLANRLARLSEESSS